MRSQPSGRWVRACTCGDTGSSSTLARMVTAVREVVFHDSVIERIDSDVAAYEPERGGILLGPIGIPVVSEFIPDPYAAATGSTFSPSPQVGALVAEATKGNLEVKGIVHSHPGMMDHPSNGDRVSFGNWMGRMPWISFLITPIVTVEGRRRGGGSHKIDLANGELSVFIAEKRREGQIAVMEATPRILRLSQAVAEVSAAFNAVPAPGPMAYVPLEGHPYASKTMTDANGGQVTLMVPYTFPLHAPLILAPRTGHRPSRRSLDPTVVPLTWDISVPEERRLEHALGLLRSQTPKGGTPFQDADPPAADAGQADVIRAGLRARLDGSLSTSIQGATVLVVGLGSGGSQTVEMLARSSVENFIVIDPDVVGPENLSRSVYDARDIGSLKCEAIARHVHAVNPGAIVDAHPKALDEIGPDILADLMDSVDFVVAATDDPDAQYRINHVAWERRRPALFAGIYERGAAGEVIFTVPGLTSCFRCATAGRRGGRRGSAALNYGTGTLVAEPALGADITHVVSASVKILLGLMELSDGSAHNNSAASMVAVAAGAGRNYLQMSTVPDYDYFPRVFNGVRGQHAYQSVWLETSSDPACPTCGTSPVADVLDVPVRLDALVPIERPTSDERGSAAGQVAVVAENGEH